MRVVLSIRLLNDFMKKCTPLLRVSWLPFKLRLWLARFALWRLKHGKAAVHSLLLMCLVVGSAGVGYAVAINGYWQSALASTSEEVTPQLASATATTTETVTETASAAVSMHDHLADAAQPRAMATEVGQLQAEVVRLRVLFKRLANLAQLEDGEFDLDMRFEPALKDMKDRESSSEAGNRLLPGLVHQLARSELPLPATALPLVKQALVHISEQAARMYSVFLERRMSYDSRVAGLPVVAGHISSRFGYRVHPVTGHRQLHKGLDLASKPGSRILALADGIVTYSGKNGGYGNLVELEHPDGFRTRYAHNSQLLVPLGGRVRKGQVIATMGSSGRSTGTHVHVEVRLHGRAVDPQLYIR